MINSKQAARLARALVELQTQKQHEARMIVHVYYNIYPFTFKHHTMTRPFSTS